MSAGTFKPLFLGPWLLALGVLCYGSVLGMGVIIGQIGPASRESVAWPVTWALAAALWWVFHGPRLCNLVHSMVALQLPGARMTLLRGIGVHMVLSISPPLLCLLLWPPAGQDTVQLAAALWLGACFGLWAISLPSVLFFIPATLLSLYWQVLADPALCAMLGVFALTLTWGLWHWQSRHPRTRVLTPFGVVLDGYALSLPGPLKERLTPTAGTRESLRAQPDHLGQARVAALLGRNCQTLRQIYGKRGQAFIYLSLGGLLAFCYWLKPGYDSSFIALWAAVVLVWIPLQPIGTLIDLHGRNRAILAELLLAPGLPPREQLQATLMRQLRRCMLERQLFMTLLIMALGAHNDRPGLHQPAAAIAFCAFMLMVNQGLVRLAWRGALSRKQLALGAAAAMLLIYLCTLMLRNA